MTFDIQSYSFGSMTVDGKTYTSDLILGINQIKTNWWRKEGHQLHLEDLDFVLEQTPDILIIGTGSIGRMNVSQKIINTLAEKYQIKCITAPTKKAIQKYNKHASKKKVCAGFHLTC